MPYNTNKELADKVRGTEKLSPRKKRQFRHVFNESHEKGDSEDASYAKAWGVVNKTAGIIIGPSETEGTIWDATRNKDILDGLKDVKVARELISIIRDIENP